MTNEEAINLLDNLIGMVEDNQNSDYDKALHMAIDALKQPERKKGRITYTHFSEELWGQSAICLSCGCKWQIAEGGEDNFCPNCGSYNGGDENEIN